MITSAEIRQSFLDYFAEHDHSRVASSSLVPANDPTLLFTNAGMVPFKDVFLGAEKRSYTRATSSQRCVRAGGKHNDLDQVGYTARHHTFFEMLGNFSFGDYFKEAAIKFAWEYLTEVVKLPKEKLWVTVFEKDQETEDIWLNTIGVDPARLSRIGAKDNFWAMGDTGPCGPCTEIFYDHGPEVAGGPPGTPEEDGDRYVEIWNLVFMQFDRNAKGELNPLPAPCVDTGMGLERLAAVLQGVHSNYEIDLFQYLIKAAARIIGADDLDSPSLRVLADHIRACAFLITDGVMPSREGRGYVLRRIIRRAVRHGHKLGAEELFFYKLTQPLIDMMGDAYPELAQAQTKIEDLLRQEEERFRETLAKGMSLLNEAIANSDKELDPETAFKLYDTYGFPLDLTQDVAREHNLSVHVQGFERLMEQQRQRAREAGQFKGGQEIATDVIAGLSPTEFTGYTDSSTDDASVVAILVDGDSVDSLNSDQDAVVLLDKTPFYAESGGQIGDTGKLVAGVNQFQVSDTKKLAGNYHGHQGRLSKGQLQVGDKVSATIDGVRRNEIVVHHSATHLLHSALRQVLGDHVEQKGSLVAAERLRFDFSHPQAVTPEQMQQIETLVNAEIRGNADADIKSMTFDEAIEAGAMALFGEKYGDQVRVLQFGDFSIELCGGTHVDRVGDIGLFKIISESGIAAGVRRIEAVAGEQALQYFQQTESTLRHAAELVQSSPDQLINKLQQLTGRLREQKQELERLQTKLASQAGNALADQAVSMNGYQLLVAQVGNVDAKALRNSVDQLKQKLGDAVILLAAVDGDKIRLAAGVSDSMTAQVQAGKLVNYVAEQVDGKGGGRPDFAQAGGQNPEKLPGALDSVKEWLHNS